MAPDAIGKSTITQVVNTLARSDGGPARHSLEVNFALNRAGKDVRLVAMKGASSDSLLQEMSSREDFPRVAPTELDARSWALYRKLLRQISNSQVLIIHGYYLWWVPLIALYAGAQRIPVVVMPHGALTRYDRRKSRIKKFIFNLAGGWLVNSMAHFVVASSMEKEELPDSIARQRITVVGAGAEFPRTPSRPELRFEQPIQLVTLSRIAKKKRLDLVLEATRVLMDRGVDARLTIAGDGSSDYIASLKSLANELGLRGRAHFVGPVGGTDKSTLLERSHIFVLPSDDENFGLAFAEAAMYGIPAVVSDRVGAAGNLPERAGTRITSPDAETIADAVMHIVSNYPDAADAMRDYAREEFSWPSVAQRWIDALPSRRGWTPSHINLTPGAPRD